MPEIEERQQTVQAGPGRKTSSERALQNVSVALIDAPVIVGLPER